MCRIGWRFALFGLTLMLPACSDYVSSPLAGAGGFITDTHSFHTNPNQPVSNAPNVQRVEGIDTTQEPLTPEEGDVWPGPVQPSPTLQDIEQEMQQEGDGSVMPTRPLSAPTDASPAAMSSPDAAAAPRSAGGMRSYSDGKGGTGIVVPNGNGTSTRVGADGTITTVPDKQ